jgi:NAD(P)H dehydrogenase (quinone)
MSHAVESDDSPPPTAPSVIVVVTHPNPHSFNHGIAHSVCETLIATGYQVFYHDLYQEPFDPRLSISELALQYEAPADIAHYCRELVLSTGLIVIHPNWYGQPPAVLKGWVDRVFMPGVVHSIPAPGEICTDGLLTHLDALVINTSDVELEREQREFGDPLDTIWKNCILGFSGVRHYRRLRFTEVYKSTPEQRSDWLRQVETTVRELFPGGRSRGAASNA